MSLSDLVKQAFLAGALATAGVGAGGMNESVAYGQQRMTIEEFYKKSKPADDVLPGARVMPYGVGRQVDGEGVLLRGNEFARLYFDDPKYSRPLQDIFRGLHGQRIYNSATGNFDIFDFQKFYDLISENRENLGGVVIYQDGYFEFCINNRTTNVVIPIPELTAKHLIAL